MRLRPRHPLGPRQRVPVLPPLDGRPGVRALPAPAHASLCRIPGARRIVSLVPAATEIVAALGLTDDLVGVSHECDFPAGVASKPRVTHSAIHAGQPPSAEVDRRVRTSLAEHGTLYTLDEPLLRRLRPELILTQRLCDVCAVGYDSVAALAASLPGPPHVVSLEPACLED
ncbi:MAG TPA: hypothetical protein VJS92_03125, partial [Candidatus Polarisedimenticolaceae bacterium]|nr:hypothetical protein [Candidatus Polarisedimenticolaceae bacterium]